MKKPLLFCTLSFVLCIWVAFAYTSDDTANANYLADQGVVTKQTTASQYRLDDKILRQEVIAMALKIKWIAIPTNTSCKKYYADATKNDWVCRAVELAADNGIITRGNKYANPGKFVTRAEALAMMMKAGGKSVELFNAGWITIDSSVVWQQNVFISAYISWIISPEDIFNKSNEAGPYMHHIYRPNFLATRAEVFAFTKNTINTSQVTYKTNSTYWISYNADIYSKLEEDAYGNKLLYFGNERNVSVEGGIDIRPAIRIEELNWAPVDFLTRDFHFNKIKWIKNINGVDYLNTITLDMFETTTYWAFWENYSFSLNSFWIDIDQEIDLLKLNIQNSYKFSNKDVLKIYYRFLGRDGVLEKKYMTNLSSFLYIAYYMRSPSGVSEDTFFSWYKNTESVTFREDTLKDLWDNTYEFLVDTVENGKKSTFKVKSKVYLEKFTIDNISSVKQ